MTEPELPPWLHEGARVAILAGRGSSVRFDVIKKIGKLHIVLEDDDEKYRVGTRDGVKQRDSWTPRSKLADPESPEVRKILAERRLASARSAVGLAYNDWRKVEGRAGEIEKITAMQGALRHLDRLLNDQ